MYRVFEKPDSGTDVKRRVLSYVKGGREGVEQSLGEQTPRFEQEMFYVPLGNYPAMLPWIF